MGACAGEMTMKLSNRGPENRLGRREREHLDMIAAKYPQEPEVLLRLDTLKRCEPIAGQTAETEKDTDEMAGRKAAVADMVRLIQELGLE